MQENFRVKGKKLYFGFVPYSGLHCRRIAHRRLEMLSIRTPDAPILNL